MMHGGDLSRQLERARGFLNRGVAHRARLREIDIRIAVTGTRGKSTTTRWLYETFVGRGYDTYAKITGEQPHSLYDGERHPIERSGPVKLYETEREIRHFKPEDVCIVENQGIHEYTTRLVNQSYVDPTVVVVTNVRHDHLDTLGSSRREITRSFARSIPSGTHVISGEKHDAVNKYLAAELERRNATITIARPTSSGRPKPADELVAIVDAVLRRVGVEPLTTSERQSYRYQHPVKWVNLPGGRLFDAANVNDVESTELIRQVLMGRGDEEFRPVMYFRRDRPGRTASFVKYLNILADAGLVSEIHGIGAFRAFVTKSLTVPVVWHDETSESPGDVLDAVLDVEPVIFMGNVVPQFMQDLQAEILTRSEGAP